MWKGIATMREYVKCEWTVTRGAQSGLLCTKDATATIHNNGWPDISFCDLHLGRWLVRVAADRWSNSVEVGGSYEILTGPARNGVFTSK